MNLDETAQKVLDKALSILHDLINRGHTELSCRQWDNEGVNDDLKELLKGEGV